MLKLYISALTNFSGVTNMSLTKKQKADLNKFTETQPALNDSRLPFPKSAMKLGDLIDEAHGQIRSKAAHYDVSLQGGVSGTSYFVDIEVPAGAIATRVYTAPVVALDSAGDAVELDVKVGVTSLIGGPQAQAALNAGALDQSAAASLPVALTAGKVSVTPSVEDVTAGKLLIVVEYIQPLS